MADAQPAAPAQPQQQQLLRPDDILKLQCMNDDERPKCRLLIQNFWNIIQSPSASSDDNVAARQKLSEYSQKLILRERAYRQKMKQQAMQQQAGGQAAAAAGAGSSQQAGQAAGAGAGANASQPIKQESAQGAQRPAEGAAPAQPNQGQQPAQQRPQGGGPTSVDPQIIQHVQNFPIVLPANAAPPPGTPEYDAKIKEYRNGYLSMLAKQASFNENRRKITLQIEERQKNGQEPPPEMLQLKAKIEKEYGQMKEQVDKFRRFQKTWREEREAKAAQGQQPQVPAGAAQQAQRQPPQSAQSQVKEEQQVKVEPAPPTQQPNMQFNLNQPPQGQQMQPHPQQNRPPPAPHSQSMPAGQPGQQHFAQPGSQQPHPNQQRPQINPHQAAAHQHSTNSPHPQSATSAHPGGPPVPLSHQAAVSAANRSYTDPQRTATPLQAPGGGSFNSREQMNNPKMPIPRHLNVASPSAVHMGQARPTMSGPTNGAPGPMGQPVIPRPPPFQLEGEGDRVLSKRKLDELVRQVTGGGEEALTPEVEEAVLTLADDFIDTVTSLACRLSKLRESPQLDIRDLQLVLERNYNIRIPGFASDEIRTVRKVVPAAGWVDKMKMVNAAKVMGGKNDF